MGCSLCNGGVFKLLHNRARSSSGDFVRGNTRYRVSSATFLLYLTSRHAFWAIELEVLTKPVLPIPIVTDEQGGFVIKLGEHAFARDSTLPSIFQ